MELQKGRPENTDNRLDAVRESNAIGVSRIAGIHAGLWHFKIVHIQKAL